MAATAEDPKKTPRVTAYYDSEVGLAFEKQASADDCAPGYFCSEFEDGEDCEVEVTVLRAEFQREALEGLERKVPSTSPLKKNGLLHAEKMETYAVMDWITEDKVRRAFATSPTDREGDLCPEWNYTCQPQRYRGRGEQIRLQVYESSGTTAALCGEVTAFVDELLEGTGSACSSKASSFTRVGSSFELPLELPGVKPVCTGKLTVQASLRKVKDVENPAYTHVDPRMFEDSITRVGVSGGTAPFFRLALREEYANGRSPSYYIGKDLSHAADEVLFYEKARNILLTSEGSKEGLASMLQFTFEYAGILTCSHPEHIVDGNPRDLLVLRNLHDGCRKLRLLDLKIGQKTGSAGWQGKSQTAAMRQAVIDGATNSALEGFRLEGFDGAPPSLTSMDPLLDFGGGSERSRKRSFRLMLQRMSGAEVLMHFLDVHQEPNEEALEKVRTPLELSELVLREIVRQLSTLAAASRSVPTPQKWIGSSVALGFDCGRLPSRDVEEEDVCRTVKVHIFDWGRSELNTPEAHRRLSKRHREDRAQFWQYYAGGIDRLAWEAARAYWHRFSNDHSWHQVFITVMDFNSHAIAELIGRAHIHPLEECEETTVELRDDVGTVVRGWGRGSVATVTYSVQQRHYPEGSPLASAWRISIIRANNLPRVNWTYGTTDAFAELLAVSHDGVKGFRQVTSVKANTVSPEWGEVLELPIARSSETLPQQLNSALRGLGREPLDVMLPCESCIAGGVVSAGGFERARGRSSRLFSAWTASRWTESPPRDERPDDCAAFSEWTDRLNQAAAGRLSGWPDSPQADNRRIACSHYVTMLEQSGRLPARIAALVAGVLSCIAAASLPLASHRPRHAEFFKDPLLVAAAVGQLFLAICLLIFELPPACLSRLHRLDSFHDFLLDRVSCLAKVKGRGLAYDIQGIIWFFEWISGSCTRHFIFVTSMCQCFVGGLHVLMTLGLLPVRIVRKARRVWSD